jgi:hypothetical protein
MNSNTITVETGYTNRSAYINALVAYVVEMINRAETTLPRRDLRRLPHFVREFTRRLVSVPLWRGLSGNPAAQRHIATVVMVHAKQYARLITPEIAEEGAARFHAAAYDEIYIAQHGVDHEAWQTFRDATQAYCAAQYAEDFPDADDAEREVFSYAAEATISRFVSAEVWHKFRDDPTELADWQCGIYDAAFAKLGNLSSAAQVETLN